MTKVQESTVIFVSILAVVGASASGLLAPRVGGALIFYGMIVLLRRAAGSMAGGATVRAASGSYRPRDQGVWADPPVAELDKSTFGLLLASRLWRDPRLRVVDPRTARNPPPPGSSDDLWDRELDG